MTWRQHSFLLEGKLATQHHRAVLQKKKAASALRTSFPRASYSLPYWLFCHVHHGQVRDRKPNKRARLTLALVHSCPRNFS